MFVNNCFNLFSITVYKLNIKVNKYTIKFCTLINNEYNKPKKPRTEPVIKSNGFLASSATSAFNTFIHSEKLLTIYPKSSPFVLSLFIMEAKGINTGLHLFSSHEFLYALKLEIIKKYIATKNTIKNIIIVNHISLL